MNKTFAFTLLLMGSLSTSNAVALESRFYGDATRKTKVNPKSKHRFPKAMEVYNINLIPNEDKSEQIKKLHAEGKRVICFLSVRAKPRGRAKAIESAMNAGCDEVAVK